MALPPDQFSALKHAAMAAKQTAYCPYSSFRVGAALLLSDTRTLITGANVENAAYPAGTCAERVALGKAVTWVDEGEETATGEGVRESVRKGGILALGVATDVTPPASPCGMCRQFIREFCKLSMPIYMFDRDGNHVVKTLEELLPMSFGPEDLVKG
ncbi:hypothetical protein E4U43_007729 [Claviceps pusilla]|uniref:Cytidine deaminase n=1 Tax=Claviceps pusilla TaxID=123648 RepID=A0A9P7NE99_9HYPO|nr:hypothetical protein E4U43_007729 [Claviceps pusilla]